MATGRGAATKAKAAPTARANTGRKRVKRKAAKPAAQRSAPAREGPVNEWFELRRSPIQGFGAFAIRPIPKGTRIIEYAGERIPNAEADRRDAEATAKRHHTFLFILNRQTVIDAAFNGNAARFINHSCDPNCVAIIEPRRIWIDAAKRIPAGTELVYDYEYDDLDYTLDELRVRVSLWVAEMPRHDRRHEATPERDARQRMTILNEVMNGLVDYAGLFPPAGLGMGEALREYASYWAGEERWMLGRFIVPVSRLDELVGGLRLTFPREAPGPWPLSAILGGDPDADVARVGAFNLRHEALCRIRSIEVRLASTADIARVAALAPSDVECFFEIPWDAPLESLIDAVGAAGASAKMRMGGVTEGEFPAPTAVVRFLRACITRGVPFKATAGLHHAIRGCYPLTYAPDAPTAMMYGYLNVFLAAAFMRVGMPDADALRLLVEADVSSMRVSAEEESVTWDRFRLGPTAIMETRRNFARSFGSCSFREPAEEYHANGFDA